MKKKSIYSVFIMNFTLFIITLILMSFEIYLPKYLVYLYIISINLIYILYLYLKMKKYIVNRGYILSSSILNSISTLSIKKYRKKQKIINNGENSETLIKNLKEEFVLEKDKNLRDVFFKTLVISEIFFEEKFIEDNELKDFLNRNDRNKQSLLLGGIMINYKKVYKNLEKLNLIKES